jgi:hypothetical protein
MTALLGALELSALRAVAASSMVGSAVLWRRVLTSDGAGGQSGTASPVGTVPCRAVPRRGEPSVGQFAGRVEARGDWYLYVPQGTSVDRRTDYVVLASGGTFDVLYVNQNRTSLVETRLTCLERR